MNADAEQAKVIGNLLRIRKSLHQDTDPVAPFEGDARACERLHDHTLDVRNARLRRNIGESHFARAASGVRAEGPGEGLAERAEERIHAEDDYGEPLTFLFDALFRCQALPHQL